MVYVKSDKTPSPLAYLAFLFLTAILVIAWFPILYGSHIPETELHAENRSTTTFDQRDLLQFLSTHQILADRMNGEIEYSISPPLPADHNVLWSQMFGSKNDSEVATSLVQCQDGGYALAGYWTSHIDGDTDFLLIRTDEEGNQLWNQTYSRVSNAWAESLVECQSGGFAIAGDTYNSTTIRDEGWLVRTDADGNHLWNFTYSGDDDDSFRSLTECSDGGFAMTGITRSYGAGGLDIWVVRTDASGGVLWNQSFGTPGNEWGESIIEVSSGGFAIAGYDDDSALFLRLDQNGNYLWNHTFGVSGSDEYQSVVECSDKGFALTGMKDFKILLVRTNETGDIQWYRTYCDGYARALVESIYGGFAIAGNQIGADTDCVLIITDENGNPEVERSYGKAIDEYARGLVGHNESGFTIAGYTDIAFRQNVSLVHISRLVWIEPPTDQVHEFSESYWYDLNATSSAGGVNRWSVNDTMNFSITDNGTITIDNPTLVGSFGLLVWVSDNLDNVLIGNFTLTIQDTTPPMWLLIPTNQDFEFGSSFEYDLLATDSWGIEQWWINDTTYFTISRHGTIANRRLLPVADYFVEVRAYDDANNYCTSIIRYRVRDTVLPSIDASSTTIVEWGENLVHQVSASDLAGLHRWTVNNTILFAINSTGYITNRDPLQPGQYFLQITVNDTHGNSATTILRIVQNPIPFHQVALTIGIPVVVVIVLVIVGILGIRYHRRRRTRGRDE